MTIKEFLKHHGEVRSITRIDANTLKIEFNEWYEDFRMVPLNEEVFERDLDLLEI